MLSACFVNIGDNKFFNLIIVNVKSEKAQTKVKSTLLFPAFFKVLLIAVPMFPLLLLRGQLRVV